MRGHLLLTRGNEILPLEALSIGVEMKESDIAIRCNIVTISEDEVPFEEKTIIDHSADEISTEDCAILLEAVRKELETESYKFRTEEHTSELQSRDTISYAVSCLKKKRNLRKTHHQN